MEKIKDFFKQFYSNKKLFWGVVGGVAALLVILGVVLALVLGGSGGSVIENCTVTVKTEGGMALKDIGVYVYTDEDKAEMVTFTKTDEAGVATLTVAVPEGSVAVLDGVAAGFVTQESYPITTADTQIVLEIELLKEMAPITLGGVMFDFTVTDTDGNEYTLSKLLEEKDAVVLNFWYTNCGPCKTEFPYLQEAYNKYSASIALLALDPVDEDDEAAVKTFKTENGLTLPMAKVDAAWADQISGIAYPTTVIIDRYGMVTLIHVGGIDNAKTFENAFVYFTAEDYVQTVATSINEMPTAADKEAEAGTKENPLAPENHAAFSVEVPAGQTVYYNLGAASGNVLEISSETVKITCGSLTLEPVEGVIKLMLIGAEDGSAPILVGFTNTGAEAETYKVSTAKAEGGKDNPIVLMKLGDVAADVVAGNVPGVYYTYTVTEDGNFTVTVKDGDNESKFDIALSNEDSGKTTLLSTDGVADTKEKTTSVSVAASKGDQVQITVTVEADEVGNYNAAVIKFAAAVIKEDSGNSGSSGNSGNSGSSGGSSSSGGNSSSGNTANYDGKLVNADDPYIQFGPNTFTIDVGAGEKKLVHLVRMLADTTLCIYDSDAYVVLGGKTYKPNSSGNVFVSINGQEGQGVLEMEIGNSGSDDQSFRVSFYFPEGSYMNPYDLTLGEFTTNVAAGNEQGVYYTYTAAASGKLTVEWLSGANAGIVLYNENSYAQVSLAEASDGKTVTIDVNKGDVIQIIVSTVPDQNFNYPAATIKAKASLGS